MILEPALALALLALTAGALLWWASEWRRRQLGVPRGRAVYLDHGAGRGRVLPARSLPLRGRPDLLVQAGGAIIPVELKTGHTPPAPHPGHVLQLLAYCLLVEEHYQVRPPYGLIRYPGREFRIPYDRGREQQLRAVVQEIALEKRQGHAQHRSHQQPRRCAACAFRAHCDERLAG